MKYFESLIFQFKALKIFIFDVWNVLSLLTNKTFDSQEDLDNFLIQLDGTPNKCNLRANAILPVSMAFARVAANAEKIPLYRYLNADNKFTLPVPCMDVIYGEQQLIATSIFRNL